MSAEEPPVTTEPPAKAEDDKMEEMPGREGAATEEVSQKAEETSNPQDVEVKDGADARETNGEAKTNGSAPAADKEASDSDEDKMEIDEGDNAKDDEVATKPEPVENGKAESSNSNAAAPKQVEEQATADDANEIMDDDNFAVIVAFLERFGAECGTTCPTIDELQRNLCSREETDPDWVLFHVKLLRKINKSVNVQKWERSLMKFVYSYSADDGWELERMSYRLTQSSTKLRMLKNLMESQFDFNVKFKNELNKKPAADLRSTPLGYDKMGNAYWYQIDAKANLRVYKDDPDEETWELVAKTKDELVELIGQLKTGSTFVKKTDEKEVVTKEDEEEEDEEYDENIIRDTGPVPESEQTSYNPSAVNSDDDEPVSSPVKANVEENGKLPAEDEKSTPVKSETNAQSTKEESPKASEKVENNESCAVTGKSDQDVKDLPPKENTQSAAPEEQASSDALKTPEEKTAKESIEPEEKIAEKSVTSEEKVGEKSQSADKALDQAVAKEIADVATKASPAPTERLDEAQSSTEQPSGNVEAKGVSKSSDELKAEEPKIEKKPSDSSTESRNAAPEDNDHEKKQDCASNGKLPSPVKEEAKDKPSSVKSHFSIASLVSKDDDEKKADSSDVAVVYKLGEKRALEVESPPKESEEKKAKLAENGVSEAKTEETLVVTGNGSGAANNAGNPIVGDAVEEPMMMIFGRGSGAENLTRNPSKVAAAESNGTRKKGNGVKSKRKMAQSDDDDDADEDSNEDDNDGGDESEEEPVTKSKPKKSSKDNSDDEEDEDDEPPKKKASKETPKKAKREEPKANDEPDEATVKLVESMQRSSRRTSSRIATMRIIEAEKRQREEEMALEEYKEKQKRKAQREAKLMEKYRALGRDYQKEMKAKRKKRWDGSDDDFEADEDGDGDGEDKAKRKRRKKKKKKRGEENLKEFARFSSGSSSGDEGLEGEEFDDEEHLPSDDDDLFKSDHEFSCESDVPDDEAAPVKHARTATKTKKKSKRKVSVDEETSEEEEDENFACQKCGNNDAPEWILLCDSCDDGWHASCLRPALMVIPEGSWFCPNCQHKQLLEKLEKNLGDFESLLAEIEAKEAEEKRQEEERKKQEAESKESKRKARLAFVSQQLSKTLKPKSGKPAAQKQRKEPAKRRRRRSEDSSGSNFSDEDSSSSSSKSSSEEDVPAGGRRRAARNVSYTMKEYDDMIKEAIVDGTEYVTVPAEEAGGKKIENLLPAGEYEDDDVEEEERPKAASGVSGAGRGKDMSNILGASEDEEEEAKDKEKEDAPAPLKMVINTDVAEAGSKGKGKGKKGKKKSLNDFSSDDDGDGDSGSDFQASDAFSEDDDDDDFEEEQLSSEDDVPLKKKGKAATRKSTRSRKVMYDEDFVFDGSDSDEVPLKKSKKRGRYAEEWDSEFTEESDEESYGRKKKGKAKKGKKKPRYDSLSSEEEDEDFDLKISNKKKKLLSESGRRTRGKKITFEAEESGEDSLDEEAAARAASQTNKKKRKKDKSDTDMDEDDYVSEPEESEDEEDSD